VAFHQPMQRLLPELRQLGVAGVARQARGGDLQAQGVIALGQQRLRRFGEPLRLAASQQVERGSPASCGAGTS
jgi:hypothetical protein